MPADKLPKKTAKKRVMSPVLQFALLLSPIVMSCFFLVYGMTGWLLEGRDKLNWSIEAGSVALYVGTGIGIYCVLVAAFARWRGAGMTHPLMISAAVHLLLSVLVTVSILVTREL